MRSVCGFALLAVVLIAGPLWAQGPKVYRIGALVADDQFIAAVDGFKQRMAQMGYVEGKNVLYNLKTQRRSGCA